MIIQQTYACVEVLVLLGSGLYVRIVSPIYKGLFTFLSYDGAHASEITPCNKIEKPLVVY